jgi:hypothetical protein
MPEGEIGAPTCLGAQTGQVTATVTVNGGRVYWSANALVLNISACTDSTLSATFTAWWRANDTGTQCPFGPVAAVSAPVTLSGGCAVSGSASLPQPTVPYGAGTKNLPDTPGAVTITG